MPSFEVVLSLKERKALIGPPLTDNEQVVRQCVVLCCAVRKLFFFVCMRVRAHYTFDVKGKVLLQHMQLVLYIRYGTK